MENPTLRFIIEYTIALPVIAGFIRLPKMDKAFYPSFILFTLGLINEAISDYLIAKYKDNSISFNIFHVVEINMLIWQYVMWRYHRFNKLYVFLVCVLVTGVWAIINFRKYDQQTIYGSAFAICYYFAVTILFINVINKVIIQGTGPFLKNPVALGSLAYVFSFLFLGVIEIFYSLSLMENNPIETYIYTIVLYVNLITYFIFIFAFLWTPRKKRFILQ